MSFLPPEFPNAREYRVDTRLEVELLEAMARAAESKFERLRVVDDIDEAIQYRRQILPLTPDGNAGKPRRLGELGAAFLRRFMRLGDLVDLDLAIEYGTHAVLLTPNGHPLKPGLLSNLGVSHESRFESLGELADLDQAMEYQTQAIQLIPDGHFDKPGGLSNLGASYQSRFRRLGEITDLNKAIEYLTRAVLLAPDGHPEKPSLISNLGNSYRSRFEHLGELADLNEAIEYITRAMLLVPDGHPDKPILLNNLGISYQSRFGRLGEFEDLKKAISYNTQVVMLTPDGHVDKPSRFNNLGISYLSRFERLGEIADLNKAIEYYTQAMLLTPDGHVLQPGMLTNLGNSYASRFWHLGELADLNKAIGYQTQAVLLTPHGHADKHSRLSNLGNSYRSRFERLGELADLNKAIEHQTQAVLLTPDGHGDRHSSLNNIGISYGARFRRLGELTDLDEGIKYLTQATLLTPDGHPDKPTLLNNLGNSYESRFGQLGESSDLNKAIEFKTQVVTLTPDGYASKPRWLYSLGASYQSRFSHLGRLSDLESAHSYFQDGAQLIITHPEIQLKSARNWAHCSSLLGISPQPAYERCMQLIPRRIWLGTTIDQRYTLLNEIFGLATEAAAWAISVESFDLALEWLEEGRSIVWNQILQLRTPFDNLSSAAPLLAQEIKETAAKLESAGSRQTETLTTASIHQSSDIEKETQQHHYLASKWEQLLGEARQIPGFHDFLRSRKVQELRLAATDGPIVVINTHSTRCDALIVFPECDDIAHLPLPHLSLAKVNDVRVQLDALIGLRGDRACGFKRSQPALKPEDPFRGVLMTLWTDIVQPILDVLAITGGSPTDELPHITWCTTGELSFFPLHAAGSYDGSQPSAFDLVISSYTPTLSALLNPSNPPPNLEVGMLAVGQENTRDLCPLPNIAHELAAIKTHAKAVLFQQIDGENGTIDAVLRAMEEYSWVHLACHATQNPFNPAHSAFHLHDGDLTLEAITKRAFKSKGLAFLSACQTAAGDHKLPDEAVHLAAGMLMAGYPSVIATMWSIYDEDAPEVSGEVYAQLLRGGQLDHRKAARALHKAVARLREKVGRESFKRWVPFIHMGV